MTSLFKIIIAAWTVMSISACSFGFKGISIKPEVKSFYVENFVLTDQSAPNNLNQIFSEELRLKVRQESRLTENNDDPNIIFSGTVSRYRVDFAAPDANNTASLNRLTIEIKIKYENVNDDEDTWEKTYSDFEDYDSNGNLQQLQDGLIDVIVDDILERVFNDAFTDW